MGLRKIADYTLTRELGRGGMGTVFEALSPAGATVALKTVTWPELVDARARWEAIERFQREARAARALSHPNICQVLDYGADQDSLFIVMEFLDGDSIRELIRLAGAIKAERAVEIMLRVGEALAYAHEQGIIHRDIKPENIMILRRGQVKLMDFGLASLVHETALTSSGLILGTLCYMSPEQVRGERVDARSDIFSLGATFYEMLTGARAFQAQERAALMHQVLTNDPPPVAGLPARVAETLERCLRKQPQERFQSARQMVGSLSGPRPVSRPDVTPFLPAREPTPAAPVSEAPTPLPRLESPEAEEADVRARANFRWEPNLEADKAEVELGESPTGVRVLDSGSYVTIAYDWVGGALRTSDRVSDFVFEARITKLHGSDYDGQLGVIYGQPWGGAYACFYTGSGDVAIDKRSDGLWSELVSRTDIPQVNRGNADNVLKVVRRGQTLHVFINDQHVLTGEDFEIRFGEFHALVAPSVKASYHSLRIEGIDLYRAVTKAREHRSDFEEREAKQLLRHVLLHSPSMAVADARHSYPDRRDTVLVVIGGGLMEQLSTSSRAAQLREEINNRGQGHDCRGAAVVTDGAMLAEEKAMGFPLIAIGTTPASNQITARLWTELPRDPALRGGRNIRHDLAQGGRRVAIWEPDPERAADSIGFFISSGLLDRFLEVVWRNG